MDFFSNASPSPFWLVLVRESSFMVDVDEVDMDVVTNIEDGPP